MEGGNTNMVSNAIGAIIGIFGNLGNNTLTESQHHYQNGVVIPESEVDKTPYVFAGISAVLLVLAIVFVIK